MPQTGGRRLGVDLLRGVAAYMVVTLHTAGHLPRGRGTSALLDFCLLIAVPFFLLTALYFTAGRLLTVGPRGLLRGRVPRLLLPYAVWSVVYVAMRVALYAASGRPDGWRTLAARPLDLVFLGQASAQLYFLTWLFLMEALAVGLVALLGPRLRRPGVVLGLVVVALVVTWFDPVRYTPALTDPTRSHLDHLARNVLRYAFQGLPFLAAAFVLRLPAVEAWSARLTTTQGFGLLGLVFLVNAAHATRRLGVNIPPYFLDVLLATGMLLGGFAISPRVPPSRWLLNLSACTFGIYLAHVVAVEALDFVAERKAGLIDTPAVHLTLAGLAFCATWTVVAMLRRVPLAARVLFGETRGP